MTLQEALARVVAGRTLSELEMAAVMERILGGNASAAQIAGLLVALRMRGETVGELVGAARTMRAHAVSIPGVPPEAVDTCGTGGDGASTLNVSTAAGLVVAGAGVPVAKHGNRAVSGAVGGADVLEALGVRLELPVASLGACLRATGFVYLHAPALQPAMRHAAGPRRELGVRTLFNVLGPLTNPAGVRRQVIGVFDRRWVEPLAEALVRLGAERAWVVHGAGGLDEIALEGETIVAEIAQGSVKRGTVTAADAGLVPAPAAALRIGSTAEAAALLRAVLGGASGPARDVVCLNAAAALVVAGAARDLRAGVGLASAAIDSGAAARVLEAVVEFGRRQADAGAA
ncbi:MAG: anthranilate phosphoribosyltransferase [Deltaproteobacteria bacterium]|nr:MAG: anthranilate phosphoribosyltransferase [Deltaproteobacteria bacterium]